MLEDNLERRRQWERDGFFVVRKLVAPKLVRSLSDACDRALARMRADSTETGHTTTHVSGFLLPELYADRPSELNHLVDFISSPLVVRLISDLGRAHEGLPTLRDVQYFHEPTGRSWDGPWHRDHDSPDATTAEAAAAADTLLRFRVAFAADDHLEYVAGSHLRPDTEEEARLRNGAVRNAALEGASRISLEPGDGCVFDTRGIHRGRYRHDHPRRTLDLIFGFSLPRTRITGEALEAYKRARGMG